MALGHLGSQIKNSLHSLVLQRDVQGDQEVRWYKVSVSPGQMSLNAAESNPIRPRATPKPSCDPDRSAVEAGPSSLKWAGAWGMNRHTHRLWRRKRSSTWPGEDHRPRNVRPTAEEPLRISKSAERWYYHCCCHRFWLCNAGRGEACPGPGGWNVVC